MPSRRLTLDAAGASDSTVEIVGELDRAKVGSGQDRVGQNPPPARNRADLAPSIETASYSAGRLTQRGLDDAGRSGSLREPVADGPGMVPSNKPGGLRALL
jgi:hypothetical protein